MSGWKLSVVVVGRNIRESTVLSIGKLIGAGGGRMTPLGCIINFGVYILVTKSPFLIPTLSDNIS